MKLIAVAALSMILLGCASTQGPDTALEAYRSFISQERTFSTLKIENVDEWTLKGKNMTISMEAPLNPLSAMPKDPGLMAELVDGLVRIGTVYGATVVGLELSDSPRTVTQPTPLVVRPEVINAGVQ